MKVTVLSSKSVKPAYGSAGAPATADDAIRLTVFDNLSLNEYMSVIYAFGPSSPNAELEAGLGKVLVEYREWAGRLGQDADGNNAILLNDAGALFVEAAADVALDSVMPLKSTPEVLSLHPSGDGAEELMLIQVTRFACGSLVVGFTTQHVVADARATNSFFLAWSQVTRGAAIVPAPVHDRASFFKPRDPPQIEHEHRGQEFKLKNTVDDGRDEERNHPDDEVVISTVHFSREFISKLKCQASAGARPYSSLQCVVAYLWRCVTKARGLAGHETTGVRIAVDGRARMNPPVPEGYAGNVILWAIPTTTVKDLLTRPLQYAVDLINREVARINDGYFKSFIDFMSSGAVAEEGLELMADPEVMVLSPNLEVDSWVRIPFHDLDFGAGRPLLFMPTYLPAEGQVFLVEASSGDGSMDAYVPLFSRCIDAFKNYCCYSLELGDDHKMLAFPNPHQLTA